MENENQWSVIGACSYSATIIVLLKMSSVCTAITCAECNSSTQYYSRLNEKSP